MELRPGISASDSNQIRRGGSTDKAIDRILIPLGMQEDGTVVSHAIGEVPAMLVAGTTGSGKSSFVKTLVAEVMADHTPSDVRFLISDSSRVEYGCLNTCPYLAWPIARDAEQTGHLLRFVSAESERRMALLSRRMGSDYPHLFVILDDFVALGPSKDMLASLERVLQTARLTKMHVILVTSLPSSRLLTNELLSNIDFRVAFRVTSRSDSVRTLDRPSANELGAQGEMICRSGGTYTRCVAAHMEDDAIQGMCDEVGVQYECGDVFFEPTLLISNPAGHSSIDESLVDEAARIVVESQLGSTSGLQRRLKVGYATANRIMDELEKRGIVGPPDGSRPRDVLVRSL